MTVDAPTPPSKPLTLQEEYERIGREREDASRAIDRMYRRELIRVCVEMLAWTAIGLFVAGAGFWVTDRQTGIILLTSGQIINVSGVFWAIWSAYRRGEQRGDW